MSYIKLRVDPNVDPGSAVWISAIALAMQGLSMPIGGALLPKLGYRVVVIIGCIINSGSVLVTYFTIQKGFIYVVISYAVTLGFGFGFAYAIIFSVAASVILNYIIFETFETSSTKLICFISILVVSKTQGSYCWYDCWRIWARCSRIYTYSNNIHKSRQCYGQQHFQVRSAAFAFVFRIVSHSVFITIIRLFEDEALLDRVPTAFLMLGGSLAALQFIGVVLLNQKPQSKTEVYCLNFYGKDNSIFMPLLSITHF